MIKTLFLGSNHEALETLKALQENPTFEIVGVITQPDKPVGRGGNIQSTEIKKYCIGKNIEVIHTNNKEELYAKALEDLKPDLIICKSFGEIIPKFVLDYPKYGAINTHFSLLPKYRGAVPIQKAILEGEKETGISIMIMAQELDAGLILAQKKEFILDDDTNESLRKRLIEKTPQFLIDTLGKWIKGEIKGEVQNESLATYCYKSDISKENAQIKWGEDSAEDIHNMVRAFLPWPVAWAIVNEKKTKIFEIEKIFDKKLLPGEFETDNKNFFIGTREGVVNIKRLQTEGKREIGVSEFLNGTKVVSIQ